MKKTPLLITIPLIAIVVVVAAAVAMKLFTPVQKDVTQDPKTYPDMVQETEPSKPSTFLGSLFGQGTSKATPTPTPGTAAEFSNELKATYDDGDQAELDALSKEAAAL